MLPALLSLSKGAGYNRLCVGPNCISFFRSAGEKTKYSENAQYLAAALGNAPGKHKSCHAESKCKVFTNSCTYMSRPIEIKSYYDRACGGDHPMHEHELTDHEGYELFRRAIVDRDDEAWAAIHRHFRPLLIAWARQASARAPATDHYEDIADRALARAWSALGPEQFAQFPSLAALLAYLRACVGAAVIDAARAEASRERAYQKLDLPTVATPEELVLGALSRDEFWLLVNKLISSEHERIILIESFMLGLPPRTILERHTDRFADVPEIYGAKRNLLNRLERSRDLQRIYQDLRAA